MNGITSATNEEIVRISSTEVKDMMEIKEHGNLIKKIEKHTEILKSFTDVKINVSDLWIVGTYKDSTGRKLKDYKISKKGCEFLAHKTTGGKGDLFTIKYMERFEEMEKTLSNPYKGLSKELQAIFALDTKQQKLEKKIRSIEDKMTVNYELAENLKSSINYRAVEILGGKDAEAYKKLSKKLFSAFYKDIRRTFKVNSYKNISVKNYDLAINYIENWNPKDEVLNYAIEGLNSQLVFA